MKRMNKLSEAAKFLIIAGTILIVCTLVVVGFMVMKEGKEGTNNSMAQFNGVTASYSDIDLEKYNNLTVSGSTLTELIDDCLNNGKYSGVKINYSTFLSTTAATATTTDLAIKKTDANKVRYINPSGSFKGKVTKDANGVITDITFTQTK